jgi:hypothetical protein
VEEVISAAMRFEERAAVASMITPEFLSSIADDVQQRLLLVSEKTETNNPKNLMTFAQI